MRTCVTTAPFFCARPVMSSTDTPLPSRCAAMPSSAPIVTTPVPPMRVTRFPYGSWDDGAAGGGRCEKSTVSAFLGYLSEPHSMVTKLGQRPLTQESSLLQHG